MTHSGGLPHPTGDRGQRYEVRFLNGSNKQQVLGWTEDFATATDMADSVNRHPSWSSPIIIDRHALPSYQPPLETICKYCGGKSIGPCPKQECKNG